MNNEAEPEPREYPARVAKILDDYRVVINRGAKDGVEPDQKFIVYTLEDEVVDPETEESLGRLEDVKGELVPEHIQARMATLVSDQTKKKRVPDIFSAMGRGEPMVKTVRVSLDSVEVGDYVRPEETPSSEQPL